MKTYDLHKEQFDTNGAYSHFKIDNKLYPIKAICRKHLELLELKDDFTTDNAKRRLKNIFDQKNTNNITFIDMREDNTAQQDNKISKDFNNTEKEQMEFNTKNIILYGVPGVGKTHNYKRLISLLEQGKKSEGNIFEEICDNTPTQTTYTDHEQALKENRVEFITFHQSYSYEEFIEGLRPQVDGNIEIEDGIFKNICEKARKNLENSKINEEEFSTEKLLENFKNFITEKLSNGEISYLKNQITMYLSQKNSIVLGGQIEKQNLSDEVILRDYVKFKKGEIKSYKDVKPSQNSKSIYHGNAVYYFNFYQKLREFENTQNQNDLQKTKETLKNFYLIID